MAAKVTVRSADWAIIQLMHSRHTLTAKELRQWESFYDRVKAAVEKPKAVRGEGVSVAAAIEIFRGALGRRLVVPAGNPGPQWYVMLQKRLNDSGLTAELARKAAEIAGVLWKGSIKAESIIRQADVLLSETTISKMGADLPAESRDLEDL